MCKTKAEGGRCASYLRDQLAANSQAAEKSQAALEQATAAYDANPADRTAWKAKSEAEAKHNEVRTERTALQNEYDSTRTGQRELTAKIEASTGKERAALEARKSRGAALRRSYHDTAAHAEVATALKKADVQSRAISHGADSATVTLPSDPGYSHEVSIHADSDQPPASRYSVVATRAVQVADGQWDDHQEALSHGRKHQMSQGEAVEVATAYSREHMPSQSQYDRDAARSELTRAGIPDRHIREQWTGRSVSVSLPETDETRYFNRRIVITGHDEGQGDARFTATYTESLRDPEAEPGEEHTVKMEPIPSQDGSRGFRTPRQAAADVAAYVKNEDSSWSAPDPDPWGRASSSSTEQYEPAPF